MMCHSVPFLSFLLSFLMMDRQTDGGVQKRKPSCYRLLFYLTQAHRQQINCNCCCLHRLQQATCRQSPCPGTSCGKRSQSGVKIVLQNEISSTCSEILQGPTLRLTELFLFRRGATLPITTRYSHQENECSMIWTLDHARS